MADGGLVWQIEADEVCCWATPERIDNRFAVELFW